MRKKLYNISYSSSEVEKSMTNSSRSASLRNSNKNIFFSRSLNGGFSLAELLVVVAIIAILMTITVIGLETYQARGRDSRRKADLAKFESGMTSFYAQQKFYPNPRVGQVGDAYALKCSTNDVATPISGFTSVNKCLRYLGYMDKLTADPLAEDDVTFKYRYAVLDDAIRWEASAQLESMSAKDDCQGSGGKCDDNRYEVGNAVDMVDTANEYCFPAGTCGISTTD